MLCYDTLYFTVLYYTTVMFVLFIVRFSYLMLLYLVILWINQSNYTALGLLSSCDSYSFQPSLLHFRSSLYSFSPFLPSSNPLHTLPPTQLSIQHNTQQDFIQHHYTALHFSSLRHNQCTFLPPSLLFYDLQWYLIEFYFIELTFVGGRPDWPGPCPGRVGPIIAMLLR